MSQNQENDETTGLSQNDHQNPRANARNIIGSIVDMAKVVIENFVPGGEGMVELAERAIALVKSTKVLAVSNHEEDVLNEVLAELRKRVNIKADETKDRLRGE